MRLPTMSIVITSTTNTDDSIELFLQYPAGGAGFKFMKFDD